MSTQNSPYFFMEVETEDDIQFLVELAFDVEAIETRLNQYYPEYTLWDIKVVRQDHYIIIFEKQ